MPDRQEPHKRLEAILELAQLLVEASHIDEILPPLLRAATRLFHAEGASLAMLDEEREELEFFVMSGRAKTMPFRVPKDRGIAGRVLATGRAILTNDVTTHRHFYKAVDRTTRFQTRSLLCCPVKQNNQVIGTIQVLNTRVTGGFTKEDQRLLTVLAGFAGSAMSRAQLQKEVQNSELILRKDTEDRYELLPSLNSNMRANLETLERAAQSRTTVLLLGESGTGKEVAARAIHRWSKRSSGPFVPVNCTALSSTLLESELFGHEKGAFTGAVKRKLGRFELADGGTLFLDEIGDMPAALQTSLLRVLQEQEFERVGGSETLRTNVRVVAATNKNLVRAIEAGEFREDLYYRLNVVTVNLPPLRERREDIAPLIQFFLKRFSASVNRPSLTMTDEALDTLCRYNWPGNIRELSNMIERLVVLSQHPLIRASELPLELQRPVIPITLAPGSVSMMTGADSRGSLREDVVAFKRRRIREALSLHNQNQSHAARSLGLHQSNLSRLIRQLGMSRDLS